MYNSIQLDLNDYLTKTGLKNYKKKTFFLSCKKSNNFFSSEKLKQNTAHCIFALSKLYLLKGRVLEKRKGNRLGV